ncbi:MAG: hypothetical protein H7336_04115 [Bacteriovorax sp.]|nr:hypothetical protein [Bacteriovorax sp.]
MSKEKQSIKPRLKEVVEKKISAKNHTTDETIKNKELAQNREAEVAATSDHLDNKGFKTTRVGSNRGK